jgi:hypothetical protein
MKSLNLNKFLYILGFFLFSHPLFGEEGVDIWEKKNNTIDNSVIDSTQKTDKANSKIIFQNTEKVSKIDLIEASNETEKKKELYGIFDPAENNLNLNIWIGTDGNEIKNTISRINKIKLSKTAENFFTDIIMTYAYSPKKNISEEEFLDLKIGWLIKNEKDELIEEFLNKNGNFPNKKKVIQYLVDKNIAKADLNKACKKVDFINKEIKDSYLEKFKIYCLIFKNKRNEAQLVFDILKEQNLSDSFFNNKINFLLGLTKETEKKINDKNLLNFYLSSVTVKNFNYEPNDKTDKFIWEYLNAANLITVNDIEDNRKIKNLELAANNNSLNKEKIFEIYKKKQFDLNTLINAEEVFQSLEALESRALIYQKFLLSDSPRKKIEMLVLLKDLFKKDNLSNIFTIFMSERLKEINTTDIPDSYRNVVEENIVSEEDLKLGKIKYNDKILHKSRVVRYYTEPETPLKKVQKDLENVYKKIRRNKNYFFSVKDLVLVESLSMDGVKIPKEIKYKKISKKYSVPQNLIKLQEDNEIGLLALKFVEILGEDEVYDLDPETIYFITNILNRAKLIKFRNKIITVALPSRG